MKTTIIAEIGLNHNGSVHKAQELIKAAKNAGAHYAKFQMRDMDSLYRDPSDNNQESLPAQYVIDLINKFNLSNQELFELFDYCMDNGIVPMCTPWDKKSVDSLEDYGGMSAYKISSADFTNWDLLEHISKTNKMMYCSVGMCTQEELEKTVCFLKYDLNAPFALLHCNSAYPPPYSDINLPFLEKLKSMSPTFGYSGHELGYHIPIAAVALGARIIEKHITLDRTLEGNDHKISLFPYEFKNMVKQIQELEQALEPKSKSPTQGELINRDALSKSLISTKKILINEKIQREHIDIKSPGGGLQPININELVGTTAQRIINPGEFFTQEDISESIKFPQLFSFDRPWGIPVRFHDWIFFATNSNPSLLEFHLSYKDLELEPSEYLDFSTRETRLTVHAPDLFENDHLIDLASKDNNHCNESIRQLQKVIKITKKIKPFFKCDKARIILSPGGVSMDSFFSRNERVRGYEKIQSSLEFLHDEEIEWIIQTLPPYPWYFGGQLRLNLFVFPEEIREFCKNTGHRICFDTSHSMLSCNQYDIDFIEYIDQIKDYVAHMHISDAKGTDGEGLQIGEGTIPFDKVFETINNFISFIPEIWQGHKNRGVKTWKALRLLENL